MALVARGGEGGGNSDWSGRRRRLMPVPAQSGDASPRPGGRTCPSGSRCRCATAPETVLPTRAQNVSPNCAAGAGTEWRCLPPSGREDLSVGPPLMASDYKDASICTRRVVDVC